MTAAGGPRVGSPATGDRRLARATAGMAIGTLLSRVTGLGRVVALAYALGFTRLADTYNLANTTPNVVYDLVLGGILSSFIVPVFVDQLTTRDEDDAWRGISAIVTLAVVVLTAASALFVVVAPAVIRLYSLRLHGPDAADQQAVATTLLRLFAFQVLFYGMTALWGGVLNARRRFFAPMATPVLNNLVVIAVLLAFPHVADDLSLHGVRRDLGLLLLLGLGTTAGVALQALPLVPLASRARARLRPVWDLRHPAVAHVLRLSGWSFGYVVTNQIAFAIVLVLANAPRRGGDVSAYLAAYTFFQLPYGILAVSILTALTPELTERWSRGDVRGYRDHVGLGLRWVAAAMLPAAAGYALLARPVVDLFLRHGALRSSAAHTTADLIALFAIGLPAFSGYLLMVRGYTAMQDTRTPFLVNSLENLLNVVLALALYPSMGVRGLALAFSLAYIVAFVVTAVGLSRRVDGLGRSHVVRSTVRIAIATAIMAGVVAVVDRLAPGGRGVVLAARVLVDVAVGVAVFAGAGKAFRVSELTDLLQLGRPTAPR